MFDCRNAGLLSFGADPEEPIDPEMANVKFKSSHDVLEDPRLRKEVKDDRGTSATLPPGMEGPPKRKVDQIEKGSEVSNFSLLGFNPKISELTSYRLAEGDQIRCGCGVYFQARGCSRSPVQGCYQPEVRSLDAPG